MADLTITPLDVVGEVRPVRWQVYLSDVHGERISGHTADGSIVKSLSGTSDGAEFTLDVVPNADVVSPSPSYYTVVLGRSAAFLISKGAGAETLPDAVVVDPADVDAAFALDDLADVDAGSPANGEGLIYNSTTGNWEPGATSATVNALDAVGDVNAPAPTDGQVLTYDDGNSEWIAADPTGGGGGSVDSVTGTAPITVGGTSTDPVVAISAASSGAAGSMSAADKSKLDGVEAGATADQTAAEILAKVVTVDGAGSGLDADLLDGQHATAFEASGAAASAVAAHEADTTSVHGIADTSVLATDSDVSTAVSDHAGATDPHGDRAYTDTELSDLIANGTAVSGFGGATGDGSSIDGLLVYEGGDPKIGTPLQLGPTVNTAGAVMESDYDANTVLVATTDNTPTPLTMGASTILARLASGNIIAATPAQLKTLLAIASGDVTGLGSLATLSAVGSAQITDGSVANGDLANMTARTVKMRHTNSTGAPEDATMTQLIDDLGLGMVDDDFGAAVVGTTTPTTLFASSPVVRPAPSVGDLYRFTATGLILNLTSGALSSTITCSFAGSNLWTPLAVSVGALAGTFFRVFGELHVKTVASTGSESLTGRFDVIPQSTGVPSTTDNRLNMQTITPNNTASLNFLLTATHSGSSASFSTTLYYAALERVRRAF